jgi:hypothetical protein
MQQQQYQFYKAEAELPGLVSQYAKLLIGGLLRKPPQLRLSPKVPEDALDWITDYFTIDDQTLTSFLEEALWAEMCGRAFVMVDYPANVDVTLLTPEERKEIRPFPVLWSAEHVINWREGPNPRTKKRQLLRVILHNYEEDWSDTTNFQPNIIEKVYDHRIDDSGFYCVDIYKRAISEILRVEGGEIQRTPNQLLASRVGTEWEQLQESVYPMKNGQYFNYIPGFFLDGSIHPTEPILLPLVNREISLYNKVSRRNHLLYSACSFTPVIATEMGDDQFQEIVDRGLGNFIRLFRGDTVDALKPPTEALDDLNKAIQMTVDELARMGIRLLSPDGAPNQSGVALEIRNSAQTSQLATLNARVSNTMQAIILLMLSWQYDIDLSTSDIEFTLSTDFNTSPLGLNWMQLVTTWYEAGLVPRSLFLRVARDNDVIPTDYDDDNAEQEMAEDPFVVQPQQQQLAGTLQLGRPDLSLAPPADPTANTGATTPSED